MQVEVYDKKGKTTQKKQTLNKEIFEAKINKDLMTQAVYVYLSNQRQSNAHTKNRGEVRGGGAKPWKQKGTGRARHGSSRSPIWVGGGVAFGPRNIVNYKKSLSKKMKKAAIKSAFSMQAKAGNIMIFEGIDLGKEKLTQTLTKVLATAKLTGKTLVIQAEADQELINAARNLANVDVEVVNEVNTYMIMNYKNIVILQSALEPMEKFWTSKADEPVKVEADKPAVKKTETKTKTTKK